MTFKKKIMKKEVEIIQEVDQEEKTNVNIRKEVDQNIDTDVNQDRDQNPKENHMVTKEEDIIERGNQEVHQEETKDIEKAKEIKDTDLKLILVVEKVIAQMKIAYNLKVGHKNKVSKKIIIT